MSNTPDDRRVNNRLSDLNIHNGGVRRKAPFLGINGQSLILQSETNAFRYNKNLVFYLSIKEL